MIFKNIIKYLDISISSIINPLLKLIDTYTAIALLIIFIIYSTILFSHISKPDRTYFDETNNLRVAKETVLERKQNPWVHPWLGEYFFAVSIKLFSDKNIHLAGRTATALFGLFGLFFIYKLSRLLFNNNIAALLSLLIVMTDGIYFVQSRTSMFDIVVLAFNIAAVYYALLFIKTDKIKFLIVSSIFMGLAISTKWNAVFNLGFILTIVIFLKKIIPYFSRAHDFSYTIFSLKISGSKNNINNLVSKLSTANILCILIAIPIVIYILHYFPVMNVYEGFPYIFNHQEYMYNFHTTLSEDHNYSASAPTWLFLIRPIWYDYVQNNDIVEGIICLGNPAVIWLGVISLLFLLYNLIVKRFSKISCFIIIFFLYNYLPWILNARKMQFYYYSLPLIPIYALSISQTINILENKFKKIFTIILMYIIIAIFFYYLPIWSGEKIHYTELLKKIWFNSWF